MISPCSNTSLLPESQASQIVREALRGGVSTPRHFAQEEPEMYAEENLTPSDIKSTPHYHYHGLATTQSPSQLEDHGVEGPQGSQETSKSSVTGQGQNAVSLDHIAPPSSPKTPSNTNEPPGTPSPSKAGKTISFVSPQRPPVTPLRKSRSLYTAAHRSPSPPSQDSFAGSIPVNPEAAFLAKSKRFGLPLSQLEDSVEVSQVEYPSYLLTNTPTGFDVLPRRLKAGRWALTYCGHEPIELRWIQQPEHAANAPRTGRIAAGDNRIPAKHKLHGIPHMYQ